MKKIFLIFNLLAIFTANGQTANNCDGAVPGCTTPSFGIQPTNTATNIVDFTSSNNISNLQISIKSSNILQIFE